MRQPTKTAWGIAAAIGFAIAMVLIAIMPLRILPDVKQARSDFALKFSPEVYAALDSSAKEQMYQTLHKALNLSIEGIDTLLKGLIFMLLLTAGMALYIAHLFWQRRKSEKLNAPNAQK